jgi:hypothetical protein
MEGIKSTPFEDNVLIVYGVVFLDGLFKAPNRVNSLRIIFASFSESFEKKIIGFLFRKIHLGGFVLD